MAKVLVIDDADSFRKVVTFHLTEAGHKVSGAAGGKEGIQKFIADHPDLTLTDLKMPDLDGLQVLARLRDIQDDAHRGGIYREGSLRRVGP